METCSQSPGADTGTLGQSGSECLRHRTGGLDMRMLTKICPACQKPFETRTDVRVYCSHECRRNDYKPKPTTKTCPECQREFVAGGGQVYCSADCRESHYSARPQEAKCRSCKTIFAPTHGHQLYCSPECRRRHARGATEHTIVCVVCHGTFITTNKNAATCSAACRAKRFATQDALYRERRALGFDRSIALVFGQEEDEL